MKKPLFFKKIIAWFMVFTLIVPLLTGFTAANNSYSAVISDPGPEVYVSEEDLSKTLSTEELDTVVTVIVELTSASLLDVYNTLEAPDVPYRYLGSAEAQNYQDKLLKEQQSVKDRISETVDVSFKTDYSYTAVMNAFTLEVARKDIETIKTVSGVRDVFEVVTYQLPDTSRTADVTIQMDNSVGLIGVDHVNAELGYKGEGTVVAVLDSGLDTSHPAFNTEPEQTRYTQADVAALLSSYALNAEEIIDFAAQDVFVNRKVPFAFDYANEDTDVSGGLDHGTHVAGTIAGNTEGFQGVAPEAQLMIFKVFGDGSGSTSDDIILAALEDAIKLGADSINMSLGAAAGFTTSENQNVQDVYDSVKTAGINLLVAAGNDTDSTLNNNYGVNNALSSNPDNSMVGSPSTMESALSVASSENSYYRSIYFAVGGTEGTKLPYVNAFDAEWGYYFDINNYFSAQTLDYVVVDGYGTAADYENLDVQGKIVVVSRGVNTFTDKAIFAGNAGAVGLIVVNNQAGSIPTAALESYSIPVITVAQSAGETLKAAPVKTVSFDYDFTDIVENPASGLMSSFSSIGPAPDLSLKPEITAPGGNILSSVNGGGYEVMSGTSMATPHMAGVSALLRQYLKDTADLPVSQLDDRVSNLLMSTATPILDENGAFYSPRKQGAGLVNAYNAIKAESYLTVAGDRPKAELGSSNEGIYDFTFEIHNTTQATQDYTLSLAVLTSQLLGTEVASQTFIADQTQRIGAQDLDITYNGSADAGVSVAPGETRTLAVVIRLSETKQLELFENFENGIYIEGFLTLEAQNDTQITLGLPFLGFLGQWDAASVFDAPIYEGLTYFPTFTALFNTNENAYGSMIGYNSEADTIEGDKLAFASQLNGEKRTLLSRISLLRNADNLQYSVVDDTGKTYWTYDYGQARKTYYNAQSGSFYPVILEEGWDGTDENGAYVAEGTRLQLNVSAAVEGNSRTHAVSFPFVIDNEGPVLENATVQQEGDALYLNLQASDNQYLSHIWFSDSSGHIHALDPVSFENETETHKTHDVKVDITGLSQSLSDQGYNPGRLTIFMFDYAGNSVIKYVDFGPSSLSLGASQRIEVGDTLQMSALVKPDAFADTPISWSVDRPDVATIDADGLVSGVSEGVVTITATALTGIQTRVKVYVGVDLPDESGIVDPSPVSERPEVARDYANLNVPGDNQEIAASLNEIFEADGLYYKVVSAAEVQVVIDQTVDQNAFFFSYETLSGKVEIPQTVAYEGQTYTVTSIGDRAFYYNGTVSEFVLPDTIKEIGSHAFYSNNMLSVLSVPDSVEIIGDSAFAWSYQAEINVPGNVRYIGVDAYSGNGQLGDVVLPASLEELGSGAFSMTSMTTLKIESGIRTIGEKAFMSNANLTEVIVPDSLSVIHDYLFWYTPNLKHITLGSKTESIGYAAFQMSGIESIDLPETLSRIEGFAFESSALKTITIPDSVSEIGINAFRNVKAEDIYIGANALWIESEAFAGGLSGTEISTANYDVAKAVRRSLFSGAILVGGNPFSEYAGSLFAYEGVIYRPTSDTTAEVYQVENVDTITAVSIPETVTHEGDQVSYTVTSIIERLLVNKQNILEVSLPDTIERVGERAFDQMINVKSFNIPKNLKYVGYQAFGYLGQINDGWNTEVSGSLPQSLLRTDGAAFAGIPSASLRYVNDLESLSPYIFSGAFFTSIELSQQLRLIETGAFQQVVELKDIILPDSVEYIGDSAFLASSLTSITLPSSLRHIGSNAFGSTDLQTISIPGTADSFGWNTFAKETQVTVVLNSQRNSLVKYNALTRVPTLQWDGATTIYGNDASAIPADVTVTAGSDASIYRLARSTASTGVYGTLVVDGTLEIPEGVVIEVDGTLILNGSITGTGTLKLSENATISGSGTISDSIKIPVTSLEAAESQVIEIDNGTIDLNVVVKPEIASNQVLKYTLVSGEGVVAVAENGTVTALEDGTALIRVETTDGSSISKDITLTVRNQKGTPILENPGTPVNPEVPGNPDAPSIPTDPATPTPSEDGSGSSETIPNTGIGASDNDLMIAGSLIVAGLAVIYGIRYKKKHENPSDLSN